MDSRNKERRGMKSLVLCSGGVDSAVCLAMAAEQGPVETISFKYGQTHQIELEHSAMLSKYYNCTAHHEINLPDVFSGGGKSTLVDTGLEQPHMTYAEIRGSEGVSPTYVPFRNANLISAAVAKALTRECDAVWFGAHAEDARNWAYPDTSSEFVGSLSAAIYIGTYHKIRLITPLQWLMKADIVKKGLGLKVPFELTYSCYQGSERPCTKCPTCVERTAAFEANMTQDPALTDKEWEQALQYMSGHKLA